MQENKAKRGNFLVVDRGSGGRSVPPRSTVELAALICTGAKSAFWAASASENRRVQWKGSPAQRKGSPVRWKATSGAVES